MWGKKRGKCDKDRHQGTVRRGRAREAWADETRGDGEEPRTGKRRIVLKRCQSNALRTGLPASCRRSTAHMALDWPVPHLPVPHDTTVSHAHLVRCYTRPCQSLRPSGQLCSYPHHAVACPRSLHHPASPPHCQPPLRHVPCRPSTHAPGTHAAQQPYDQPHRVCKQPPAPNTS